MTRRCAFSLGLLSFVLMNAGCADMIMNWEQRVNFQIQELDSGEPIRDAVVTVAHVPTGTGYRCKNSGSTSSTGACIMHLQSTRIAPVIFFIPCGTSPRHADVSRERTRITVDLRNGTDIYQFEDVLKEHRRIESGDLSLEVVSIDEPVGIPPKRATNSAASTDRRL